MIRFLYVHIPFCRHICAYCDFCRVGYDHGLADRYLTALAAELAQRVDDKELETIYIGGGTPTALDVEQLERLLILLQPYTKTLSEYTIEINPETLDAAKAALLSAYGINRVSLGVQSFVPRLLELSGRHHTTADIDRTVAMLMANGIDNISFDLIYGLPTQTLDDFRTSIAQAIHYPISHLSLYNLTIEPHSAFGRRQVPEPDRELCDQMYFDALPVLEAAGFQQYETSNFARHNRFSRHNLAYWHYEDFYGIGLQAAGKRGLRRYTNTSNMVAYLNDEYAGEEVINDRRTYLFELLMMGLRLKAGIGLSQQLKSEIIAIYQEPLNELICDGYLRFENDRLSATDKGYYILNDVLIRLLPE